MKAGIKAIWFLVSAVCTAGGLMAPSFAERMLEAKAIDDLTANAIAMLGIPFGLLAGIVFITLFFIE